MADQNEPAKPQSESESSTPVYVPTFTEVATAAMSKTNEDRKVEELQALLLERLGFYALSTARLGRMRHDNKAEPEDIADAAMKMRSDQADMQRTIDLCAEAIVTQALLNGTL